MADQSHRAMFLQPRLLANQKDLLRLPRPYQVTSSSIPGPLLCEISEVTDAGGILPSASSPPWELSGSRFSSSRPFLSCINCLDKAKLVTGSSRHDSDAKYKTVEVLRLTGHGKALQATVDKLQLERVRIQIPPSPGHFQLDQFNSSLDPHQKLLHIFPH
ncbi:hypothetical protein HBH56_055840 [Parastagonospora nodorum]|uniref:Uncharacterized protein n=1 Tax=Phaeosphaeria nodorum (strain SN15 / ATCC MYA-4574 / FGSC 10173) TaxID=321614 RepID=A0A7U2FBU5_PHANO|nr:hypothetical protein HBH56_055840 [Parastagonospora nodorum]QRD02429.1 hypothetical protein JI435_053850 [Parastagonospora nodorum SN15]KAH3935468.1 hypothetical protein HBH54_041650 [Parastagonospora nodorum]KAH4140025.1 hypothetical protein HBH45_081460 [Parastagonospora nodorum]KAH4155561.1 hypothetical protein HBH44_135380 [Parastagonospora nodorum]